MLEDDINFHTICSSYATTEYDPEKLALMKHSALAKLMILLHGIFCVGVVCPTFIGLTIKQSIFTWPMRTRFNSSSDASDLRSWGIGLTS